MKVAKDKPSIIPQKQPSECFFCGKQYDLVKHHCLHGRGIKPLAIQDGLWIWICNADHNMSNDSVHLDPERKKDKMLQKLAQDTLIKQYMKQGYPEDAARDLFRERYGRFYD